MGRLVPVGRVLAEQALHDGVEGAWHVDTEATQLRRRDREMLAQDLADAAAFERRAPGEALEQEHADRVQVGTLVNRDVEKARLLGRDVAGRADGLVAQRLVQPAASGQAEVDEHGPAQRAAWVDDDVGRFDVAVQHASLVRSLDRAQHVEDDDHGVGE